MKPGMKLEDALKEFLDMAGQNADPEFTRVRGTCFLAGVVYGVMRMSTGDTDPNIPDDLEVEAIGDLYRKVRNS